MNTYLSLFSGIGGFEQAIRRVCPRAECVGFSEIDPDATAIYKRHFPTHRELGDVRSVTQTAVGVSAVDLVVGGFPCTDLSGASILRPDGRTELDGAASGLIYEVVRILREFTVKHFIIENVGSMRQEMRDRITSLLSDAIGGGGKRTVYFCEIDSASVSAQRRRRIYWTTFMVTPPVTNGLLLSEILLPVTVTRTLEHSEKAKLYLNRIAGKKNPRVKWDYRFHSDSINPKSATLTSALHKGCPYNVLVDRRFSDSLERWGLRGTGLIRKFHIIELERLQTFPDGWTDGAGVCMTNRLYALGNAVTVSVVEYILGFMTAAVATA